MVVVNPIDDNNVPSRCAKALLGCPHFSSQGTKVPIYCLGTQYLTDSSLLGEFLGISEEKSLLDSFLLAQWEERMWKGFFKYDVTASNLKVVRGTQEFLAQLNDHWSMDFSQDDEKHRRCHFEDPFVFDWTKHCEELLFCITNCETADSELVPSATLSDGVLFVIANANPVEYGHVFLVPHGFDGGYPVLDSGSLEIVARVAAEINNHSFHVFYDRSGHTASQLYFQACYFPDHLPAERMPVHTFYSDDYGGIHISAVVGYPIKALVFESNCNMKKLVEVVAKTCSFLLEKNIMYNLMLSDHGKKILLFLQGQMLTTSSCLTAWECAGYFTFRSKLEFDQATEAILLQRLSSVSLDDESFMEVKQICCSIAAKIAT